MKAFASIAALTALPLVHSAGQNANAFQSDSDCANVAASSFLPAGIEPPLGACTSTYVVATRTIRDAGVVWDTNADQPLQLQTPAPALSSDGAPILFVKAVTSTVVPDDIDPESDWYSSLTSAIHAATATTTPVMTMTVTDPPQKPTSTVGVSQDEVDGERGWFASLVSAYSAATVQPMTTTVTDPPQKPTSTVAVFPDEVDEDEDEEDVVSTITVSDLILAPATTSAPEIPKTTVAIFPDEEEEEDDESSVSTITVSDLPPTPAMVIKTLYSTVPASTVTTLLDGTRVTIMYTTTVAAPSVPSPAVVENEHTITVHEMIAPSSTKSSSTPTVTSPCKEWAGVYGQYTVETGADTNEDTYQTISAPTGFRDCFDFCDASSRCVAFTYTGASDSGLCYLMSSKGKVYSNEDTAGTCFAFKNAPRAEPAKSAQPATSADPTETEMSHSKVTFVTDGRTTTRMCTDWECSGRYTYHADDASVRSKSTATMSTEQTVEAASTSSTSMYSAPHRTSTILSSASQNTATHESVVEDPEETASTTTHKTRTSSSMTEETSSSWTSPPLKTTRTQSYDPPLKTTRSQSYDYSDESQDPTHSSSVKPESTAGVSSFPHISSSERHTSSVHSPSGSTMPRPGVSHAPYLNTTSSSAKPSMPASHFSGSAVVHSTVSNAPINNSTKPTASRTVALPPFQTSRSKYTASGSVVSHPSVGSAPYQNSTRPAVSHISSSGSVVSRPSMSSAPHLNTTASHANHTIAMPSGMTVPRPNISHAPYTNNTKSSYHPTGSAGSHSTLGIAPYHNSTKSSNSTSCSAVPTTAVGPYKDQTTVTPPPVSHVTESFISTTYVTVTPDCGPTPTHCTKTRPFISTSTWKSTTTHTISPSITYCPPTYFTETHTAETTVTDYKCKKCSTKPSVYTSTVTSCDTYTIPASHSWVFPIPPETSHVSSETTVSTAQPKYTPSTIYGTTTTTVLKCPSSVTPCPAHSTVVSTKAIPLTTTSCLVSTPQAPSSSSEELSTFTVESTMTTTSTMTLPYSGGQSHVTSSAKESQIAPVPIPQPSTASTGSSVYTSKAHTVEHSTSVPVVGSQTYPISGPSVSESSRVSTMPNAPMPVISEPAMTSPEVHPASGSSITPTAEAQTPSQSQKQIHESSAAPNSPVHSAESTAVDSAATTPEPVPPMAEHSSAPMVEETPSIVAPSPTLSLPEANTPTAPEETSSIVTPSLASSSPQESALTTSEETSSVESPTPPPSSPAAPSEYDTVSLQETATFEHSSESTPEAIPTTSVATPDTSIPLSQASAPTETPEGHTVSASHVAPTKKSSQTSVNTPTAKPTATAHSAAATNTKQGWTVLLVAVSATLALLI